MARSYQGQPKGKDRFNDHTLQFGSRSPLVDWRSTIIILFELLRKSTGSAPIQDVGSNGAGWLKCPPIGKQAGISQRDAKAPNEAIPALVLRRNQSN